MRKQTETINQILAWLDEELTKRELDVPRHAKELYAHSRFLYLEALNHIQSEGLVVETNYGRRQNPYFKVMTTERENCRRLLQEFSLTPLSAAKLAKRVEFQNPLLDFHKEAS